MIKADNLHGQMISRGVLLYHYIVCNCGYGGTLTILLDMRWADVWDDKISDPTWRYEGWLLSSVRSECLITAGRAPRWWNPTTQSPALCCCLFGNWMIINKRPSDTKWHPVTARHCPSLPVTAPFPLIAAPLTRSRLLRKLKPSGVCPMIKS